MQEDFRQNTRYGYSSKNEDEEDCALSAKVKNGKGKKFHSKSESKNGKKQEISKVKKGKGNNLHSKSKSKDG